MVDRRDKDETRSQSNDARIVWEKEEVVSLEGYNTALRFSFDILRWTLTASPARIPPQRVADHLFSFNCGSGAGQRFVSMSALSLYPWRMSRPDELCLRNIGWINR